MDEIDTCTMCYVCLQGLEDVKAFSHLISTSPANKHCLLILRLDFDFIPVVLKQKSPRKKRASAVIKKHFIGVFSPYFELLPKCVLHFEPKFL